MTLNFVQDIKIAEVSAGVRLVDVECGVASGGVACRWLVQDPRSGEAERGWQAGGEGRLLPIAGCSHRCGTQRLFNQGPEEKVQSPITTR